MLLCLVHCDGFFLFCVVGGDCQKQILNHERYILKSLEMRKLRFSSLQLGKNLSTPYD